MALGIMDIARVYASALTADRLLAHWAQTHFCRPLMVQIGADMTRLPGVDNAPFIVLFADASHTGPQRAESSFDLGLAAGIVDDEWTERDGVREMRGLIRLGELAGLVEKTLRNALQRARMQEYDVEYEIMQFPLCMALASITVEESLPVGRR